MSFVLKILFAIVWGFGVHLVANPTISKFPHRWPELAGPVVGVMATLPIMALIDESDDRIHIVWVKSYMTAFTSVGFGVFLAYLYQSREGADA